MADGGWVMADGGWPMGIADGRWRMAVADSPEDGVRLLKPPRIRVAGVNFQGDAFGRADDSVTASLRIKISKITSIS
jgi:hypothetical protein